VSAVARLALLAVLTAGCAAPVEPAEEPHGYVAGAEETAEAQPRLVVVGAGVVRVLDLVTEEVHEVARLDGAASLAGDGRYAYVGAADGSVRIVDSGSWMVDHGDHVHHYRAAVREVGSVPGVAPVAVHADPAVAALALADGPVRLLDRARLDAGAVAELATVPHRGPAVPYDGHVLVPGPEVAVLDRTGARVATVEVPCPQPEGAAVTRRGVVFGCADGALLVGDAFRGEKIPYPRPVADADRARSFHHRPGSQTLIAAGGETGIWVLDVAERSWAHHGTGPVVAVNTAGAGTPLLTVTADGVLHALDPVSGRELARNPLLSAPAAGVSIEVDASRAYVNDPATGVIHEIDYGDALRVARTFDLGGAVTHMVETGR
jgi:hypothetical protein